MHYKKPIQEALHSLFHESAFKECMADMHQECCCCTWRGQVEHAVSPGQV